VPKTRRYREYAWAMIEFGNAFDKRRDNRLPADPELFAKILDRTQNVQSVIEFGAGQGDNLLAIRRLLPDARLTGVEVNADACAKLAKLDIHAVNANLLDYVPLTAWDLVLTKGLLIDIPPAQLELAFGVLYRSSRRYICIAECYNPAPQTIEDWGNAGRLFQRDFAGEMTDMFPDLELVACGFAYNRGQRQEDSITWFLLERGHL
jgi:spore coat polysaccharide biosynthesis protein SpsF